VPNLFSDSEISQASRRKGEQYTPDDARFKRSMAACVFPEFVGPTCKMISRCIVRAKGYHLPGFFISINVFNSSNSAFVFEVVVVVELFFFFLFFFFFSLLFCCALSLGLVLEVINSVEEEAYDLLKADDDEGELKFSIVTKHGRHKLFSLFL
jgi:diacylglycerol kinase